MSLKTISGVPREPGPGEAIVERIYLSPSGKRIVNVERDDDILTAEKEKNPL